MPNYGFACSCGHVEDRIVPVTQRDNPVRCPRCRAYMQRQFPVEAIRGYQPFEPFYHEALDIDITGKRQQKEAYRYFNIIEAGDTVRGARNIETSVHAPKMVPLPPTGRGLSDLQREKEQGRQIGDDMMIGVGDKAKVRVGDLPNAITLSKKDEQEIYAKSVERGMKAAAL